MKGELSLHPNHATLPQLPPPSRPPGYNFLLRFGNWRGGRSMGYADRARECLRALRPQPQSPCRLKSSGLPGPRRTPTVLLRKRRGHSRVELHHVALQVAAQTAEQRGFGESAGGSGAGALLRGVAGGGTAAGAARAGAASGNRGVYEPLLVQDHEKDSPALI